MGRTKKTGGRIVVVTTVTGDPQLVTWGRRMQDYMDALGLTQADLAAEIGVSHVSVWRWVNGKVEPKRQHKRAIADALQTTVAHLFAEVV